MSTGTAPTTVFRDSLGQKTFELKNHLGNVLVNFSDIPIPKDDTGSDLVTDAFEPDLLAAQDYYPFGAIMPGRNSNSGDYAYGFQGQLMDNEIKGTGNSINFEYRMHDPSLGRFLSIDPLSNKYPFYSPYSFSGNRIIDCIELEGLEEKIITTKLASSELWTAFLKKLDEAEIQREFNDQLSNQTKVDVIYYTYSPTATPALGNTEFLEGNSGLAKILEPSGYNSTLFGLSEADKKVVEKKLRDGKKVVAIGISTSLINDAAGKFLYDKQHALGALIQLGETVIHEEDSHAKEIITTGENKRSTKEDHDYYFKEKTTSSPSAHDIMTKDKYKGTRARKATDQLKSIFKKPLETSLKK